MLSVKTLYVFFPMVCATRNTTRHSALITHPELQDLSTRRRHFDAVARHRVDALSSSRLKQQSHYLPVASPQPPSDRLFPTSPPEVNPDDRPFVSADSARAALSSTSSPSDSVEQMHHLLRILQMIPNSLDDIPPIRSSISLTPNDNLQSFVDTVSTDLFLFHDSHDIRLLAVSCLVEVFRILAPNPPFDERDMIPMCNVILEQLCVLASPNDPMENVRFSLLEQIATIKMFVIVCDVEYLVCDIFACLYATIRPHLYVKTRQFFADILVSILEEITSPSRDVLDAALAPFVPTLGYTSFAVSLCEDVIQRAANYIQEPLCNLLNASMCALRFEPKSVNNQTRATYRKKSMSKKPFIADVENKHLSCHHTYISDIIIKLNSIAPDVLVFVLPNLEDRCRSDEVAIRLGVVNLLANLFTAREEMPTSYPSLFAEFLERNRDIDPQIRQTVVACLGTLVVMHPYHSGQIDEILRDRVYDAEENVRIAAVQSIGKVPDIVTDETLKRMCTRLLDKAEHVRSEVLRQIVSFYVIPSKPSRMDSKSSQETKLSMDSNLNPGGAPPTPVVCESTSKVRTKEDVVLHRMLRTKFLPDQLVDAYLSLRRTREFESALKLERALFERICTPSETREDRGSLSGLRRMALFLSQLSHSSFSSFCSMVSERARARKALASVCYWRLENRIAKARVSGGTEGDPNSPFMTKLLSGGKRLSDPRDKITEAQQLARELAVFFPCSHNVENSTQQCLQFIESVDRKVYERTLTAIDCRCSDSTTNEAVADVIARLGSKTSTGRFFTEFVFPRCLSHSFTPSTLQTVCHFVLDISREHLSEYIEPMEGQKELDQVETCNPEGMEHSLSLNKKVHLNPHILAGLIRYMEIIGPQYPDALIPAASEISRLIVVPISPEDCSAEVCLAGLRLGRNMPVTHLKHLDRLKVTNVIKDLVYCRRFKDLRCSSLLVKQATRLLILMWKGNCCRGIKANDTLVQLTKRLDTFGGNPEILIAPLTALAQFAKHEPTKFEAVALKSFDFSRALLNGAMNKQVGECLSEVGTNKDVSRTSTDIHKQGSKNLLHCLGRGDREYLYQSINSEFRLCLAEVVSSASKLLVYGLHSVDYSEEIASVLETFMDNLNSRHGDVFQICYKDLSMEGRESSGKDTRESNVTTMSDAVMSACNRLSISRAIIYLSKKKEFFLSVSPHMMVSTVLTGQDEHPMVRLCFAQCIWTNVLRKHLPLRWTVTMALMALDPTSENVSKVKTMLIQIFKHRRKVCQRAVQARKMHVTQTLPESTIADLLWVLTNLPGVELEEQSGFPESKKCIELLIECLCDSKEHAHVLHEYLKCVSVAEDATDPVGGGENTERLHDLCRVASAVLRKNLAGYKVNSEHSKNLLLPSDFYRLSTKWQAHSNNALSGGMQERAFANNGQGITKRGRNLVDQTADMRTLQKEENSHSAGTGMEERIRAGHPHPTLKRFGSQQQRSRNDNIEDNFDGIGPPHSSGGMILEGRNRDEFSKSDEITAVKTNVSKKREANRYDSQTGGEGVDRRGKKTKKETVKVSERSPLLTSGKVDAAKGGVRGDKSSSRRKL